MKKTLAAFGLVIGLGAGCTRDGHTTFDASMQESMDRVDTEMEVMGDAIKEKQNRAEVELEDRLDNMEDEWIRLKEKAKGNNKLQQEFAVFKNDLDEGFGEIREELGELKTKSEKAWSKSKATIENSVDELGKKLERAKKSLS